MSAGQLSSSSSSSSSSILRVQNVVSIHKKNYQACPQQRNTFSTSSLTKTNLWHSFSSSSPTTTTAAAAIARRWQKLPQKSHHHRRRRRCFSSHKHPDEVEILVEGAGGVAAVAKTTAIKTTTTTANMAVFRDQLKKIAKDPTSLESFSKELTGSQKQSISKLSSLAEIQQQQTPKVVPEPSWDDLRFVAFHTSIPFVGFGVMDNAILILAGDAIDYNLGVWLGITTMCAAAIGNIVSDVAGVLLGTAVEDFCANTLKLPVPSLTTAQRQLRSVRFANQIGCAIGLVVGCVIGMFPLLFLDVERTHALKKEVALDKLFQDVVKEAGSLVGAQRTQLYILCHKPKQETEKKGITNYFRNMFGQDRKPGLRPAVDGDYLLAKYTSNTDGERWLHLGRGIVSRSALTGEVWNIDNVKAEPDFVPEANEEGQFETYNMLCVPVLDGNGNTIAVLQAVNKMNAAAHATKPKDNNAQAADGGGFTDGDIQVLQALASHVSVSLQRMYYEASGAEEEQFQMKDAIQILKGSVLGRAPVTANAIFTSRGPIPKQPLFSDDDEDDKSQK